MLLLTISVFCKYQFYHFKQKETRVSLNRVSVPITFQIEGETLILIGCCYKTIFLFSPFSSLPFPPLGAGLVGKNCYMIYSSFPVFNYEAVTERIQNICEHHSSQKQNCDEHLQPILARFKPYTTSRKDNSGSQVGKLKKDIQ